MEETECFGHEGLPQLLTVASSIHTCDLFMSVPTSATSFYLYAPTSFLKSTLSSTSLSLSLSFPPALISPPPSSPPTRRPTQGYSCPPLDTLLVLGVQGQPTKATINGKPVTNFSFDKTRQVLTLKGLDAAMGKTLTITWS